MHTRILTALKAEDAEAVDTFCSFVDLFADMGEDEQSIRETFTDFLRRLKELHS